MREEKKGGLCKCDDIVNRNSYLLAPYFQKNKIYKSAKLTNNFIKLEI